MKTRYRIDIEKQTNTHKVYLPPEFTPVEKIAFGNKIVDVESVHHRHNWIILSEAVQKELLLPDVELTLHAFTDKETLFIGPLLGILTSGFTSYLVRPLGKRTSFFSKLLSVNKLVGALPFVFAEEHIHWEEGTITGYFYEDLQWKTREVPFPSVVYDRLPNRKTEKKEKIRKLKQRLQSDYLIPLYNPGFFSKMDIFDRLQQDPIASWYLPETYPFSSFSLIEKMLSQYGHVYLKPENGSLGLGIHQIIYDRVNGHYYCRYRDEHGQKKLMKFTSLEYLFKKVLSKRNLTRMIVQQGIHLLRVDGRIVDFRVHTNKNERGEWQVTAIAAKIGGQGSATTHISNGGEVMILEEVFANEEEVQTYREMLSNTSLYLSKILEKHVEGIIGEIGFDLGIDKNGKLWMFEANSKPGRSIFKHPELRDYDVLSRKLSLEFGIFLAEKAIMEPEELFK
ncbi:YheC/YheD family protein [Bacillus sp. B15-48]|uniref:YheC/YheD family endospore coat-associated protein n=1 Tax=Bacillus sp. B15-48 TaxID=1548601 RepID=UPI0019401DF8|nr:YheC/YheD family protein [Bacillus sp. B15-48]MBM4764106.1 YheC/YheD family protein [Bacillus sp. B15-48]